MKPKKETLHPTGPTILHTSRRHIIAELNVNRPSIPHWFLFITGSSTRRPIFDFDIELPSWMFGLIIVAAFGMSFTVMVRSRTELRMAKSDYESIYAHVDHLRRGTLTEADQPKLSAGSEPANPSGNRRRVSLLLYCALCFCGSFGLLLGVLRGYAKMRAHSWLASHPIYRDYSTEAQLLRLGILLCMGLLLAGGFIYGAQQHFAALQYIYKSEPLRLEVTRRQEDLVKKLAASQSSEARSEYEIVIPLKESPQLHIDPKPTSADSYLWQRVLKPPTDSNGVLLWAAIVGLGCALSYHLLRIRTMSKIKEGQLTPK